MSMRSESAATWRIPGWFRGPVGSAYLYTLAAMHDEFIGNVSAALKSGYPSFAEANSRGEIARDRRILLFKSEAVPSQVSRLKSWLSAHRREGVTTCILDQVQRFFTPEMPLLRIVSGNSIHAMWSTMLADGTFEFLYKPASNWDWDSAYVGAAEPATIHRWHLILYAPPSIGPWGITAPPSTTLSIGSPNISTQKGQDIANLARYWRSIGTTLWGWILSFNPSLFDPAGDNIATPGLYPDGTWYKSYNLDGTFKRPVDARYYEERGVIGTNG